jgi:hypothetical protein
MSRYTTSQTLKRVAEQRRISTVIVPVIPLSDQDTYIKTTTPERLDKLANTFYDDATLWWIIAVSNGLGKGSLYVPENTTIRIPPSANIQQIIKQANQER